MNLDLERVKTLFKNKKILEQQRHLTENYRKIYINHELPQELRYEGSNTPLIAYPRNKIRTTKYTPLSFIPKNLFFQFSNIANTYFLFIVILGAFQIFGVPNPALSAVPLIVIVIITAIKDGFEDYRRAVSDLDLNNSPIHLLTGLPNHNVDEDNISLWRRIKKATSRILFGKVQKKILESKPKMVDPDFETLQRTSTVISERNRPSTDSRRRHHIADAPLINKELPIPDNLKFKNRNWKDVHVGDFIRVRNNEEVPADIVIISTSDLESGTCFIETKGLDGETNLKSKHALDCGEGIKHANDLALTQFWVEVEQPNPALYSFKGVTHYVHNGEEVTEPITNDNVLLRGSSLRNTAWVMGLVIYTGPETKIMLNSGITPTKKSKISRELNLSVIINFCLLFILCFISGLINGLFYDKDNTSRIYYEYKAYGSTSASNGVISFFVAVIIYQSLVPISLYISIEIIKTVQAIFIYSDVKMYYEKLDYPCTPKTWNISDDLGQIEYIFSDKTGTLTQNVMEFKKCTINGKAYGNCYTEARMGMDKREGVDIIAKAQEMQEIIDKEKIEMCELIEKNFNNDQFSRDDLTLISFDYVEDVLAQSEQGKANEAFMMALALCHTVITEEDPDTGRIIFKAESPDEAALVSVARDLGFVFMEKTRNGLILRKYGEKSIEINLLAVVPFSSAKKRMSCVVEIDGQPLLITKGADNVIYERLSKETSKQVITQTALHLEEFAKEGLRTLCIAQRKIDPTFIRGWLQRYNTANSSIEDNRDELIEAVVAEIEHDLILLGGTAIEDRLQDMVPESIRILGNAGIKLWVLTGDKVETAINIGFSCNLLDNSMKLLIIKSAADDDSEEVDENHKAETVDGLLTKYLSEEFNMGGTDEELAAAQKEHSTPISNCGVIIDGASLTEIFKEENRELAKKFLLLCKNCKSVLCCRVSPSQKALVVKLVKTDLKVMTLAIGDGANDVAMIQAANVGVGIAGEEGRQAVMSSDYAIAQFRFLTRLVLVHGRWSYKRLAEMIPCFFYKNVTFTTTLFWYGIFNNFDGSYLFEYTYLMFYNLAFTSLPVIFLAILDQDVSDTVSLLVPQLYKSGILGLEWSQYKFVYYMIDGVYQSFISFFFPYFMYRKGRFMIHKGLVLDHRFWMGLAVAHIAVTSNNLYVYLQQKRWDVLSSGIVALSILVIFFWTGVWSSGTISEEFYKSGSQVFGSVTFWACFFLGVLCCMMPRFIWENIRRLYFPRDIDIIRERVKMGDFKSYPPGYDPTNFHDVEAHRNLIQQIQNDVDVEKQEFENSDDTSSSPKAAQAVSQTRQGHTPKRKSSVSNRIRSISRSMKAPNFRLGNQGIKHKNSQSLINASEEAGINPDDIDSIRNMMVSTGQLQRSSLERIRTSHQVGGITQAESLLERYNTRGTNN